MRLHTKTFVKLISLFFLTLLLGFPLARPVLASTFQLSGKITDSSGASMVGATVDVVDTSSNLSVANVTSDSSGNYSVNIGEGTYDIKVTPPPGTNFSPAIAPQHAIFANTIINFIFAPVGSVTLSGHIYGPLGAPLPNQRVIVQGSTSQSMYTDASGAYSFQLQAGNYQITLYADNNDLFLAAPQQYQINFGYSLTQNTVLDLTIPAKNVRVHIQDVLGNPVSNIGIGATPTMQPNIGGLSLGSGITGASAGASSVGAGSRPQPQTDVLGNATAWLLPTNNGATYNFTATPPSGSIYATTTLSGVTIINDTSVTINMQQFVTLSGHVYGPIGDPLPDQTVFLQAGTLTKTTTDTTGSYSLQVQAGTYDLYVLSDNNGLSPVAPQQYQLHKSGLSVSQNTTLDITIPAKRVNVHVQDAFGNAVSSIGIGALFSGETINLNIGGGITDATGHSAYGQGSRPKPLTDASGNATLWLLPTNNGVTYNFTATPPVGSIYGPTNLSNVTFTNDIAITITMQQPVSLSGHVYGPLGDALPNQRVILHGIDGDHSIYTDTAGNYLLQVQAGNYHLYVYADDNSLSLNAPQQYQVDADYSLTQNTVLDLTIPAKRVTLHVQNSLGDPVGNMGISAQGLVTGTAPIANSIPNAKVFSSIGAGSRTKPQTDASGNTTAWLLPTTYDFTVTPPAGSIYAPFTLNNISVVSDQTEIISLQFSHAAPVTTATLSPSPDTQGNYPDPTTITLSATPASGYTIANTYYTIDGGAQQTYSPPFTVSGNGSHTITYWSIDNVGVFESPNTKTFTISSRQLTGLSPAKVWVGLKNSDDVGTKFDLKAEVYAGSTLVSSGEIDSVNGGSSGFNNAKLDTINFNSFSPVAFPTGSQLNLKLYVRNTCTGPTHNSGTARLWYNDSAANSQFDATIGTVTSNYFLWNNFILGTSVGFGPKETIDVAAGAPCSPFKLFGTWTITP